MGIGGRGIRHHRRPPEPRGSRPSAPKDWPNYRPRHVRWTIEPSRRDRGSAGGGEDRPPNIPHRLRGRRRRHGRPRPGTHAQPRRRLCPEYRRRRSAPAPAAEPWRPAPCAGQDRPGPAAERRNAAAMAPNGLASPRARWSSADRRRGGEASMTMSPAGTAAPAPALFQRRGGASRRRSVGSV